MSYATWDIETTIKTEFKRKATPFNGANWVVTHGWKFKGGEVTERRFGKWENPPGWLAPILEPISLLIGMNIKFDLLHALQDPENLKAWMAFVVRGGRVWDIQLAEYLLHGMAQEHHMLSLDEIAPRYGGNMKIDEVKALWAAGVDTDQIEPALLSRYLIGGKDETGVFQMGDVENTEMVALKQIARAREVGQLNSILLNMGGLMFTVEAERNGMFVDKAKGLAIAAELAHTIKGLQLALDAYLPTFPAEFDWSWGSRKKQSALIFGGTIRYDATHIVHADGTSTDRIDWLANGMQPPPVYYQKTEKRILLEDGTTYRGDEQALMSAQFDGFPLQAQYFANGLRKGEIKTKNVTFADIERGPKTRTDDSYYTFPRMTEPDKSWETAEPGVYSVNDDVMQALGIRDIPFLKTLSKLSKLAKDLGTYYITVDEDGVEKGMLSLVGIDGLIHHMLNMTATVTARLSSSNPNLQNLPKHDETADTVSEVKTMFTSRFGPDGKIIQSDFTSLEVYVQAILTKSKQLIQDLIDGLDMHVARVASKEGVTYAEAFDKAKVQKLKDWVAKRQGAKEFSFQRAYGAGAAKIALTTGMAVEDVEALIVAESARYPEIDTYYEGVTTAIKANARPTGRFVPHPEVPGLIVQPKRSSYRTPDGKLYSYSEQPSPKYLVKRGQTTSFSPTEIRNYVVQGTGGEWAKAAMYLALVEFYRRGNFGGLALLVNQVHDAIYADAAAEVAAEAAAVLHAAMEAASEYMEFIFGWIIPVPVPTETEYGANMAEHDGAVDKAAAAVIRQQIRTNTMKGYVPSFEQGNK